MEDEKNSPKTFHPPEIRREMVRGDGRFEIVAETGEIVLTAYDPALLEGSEAAHFTAFIDKILSIDYTGEMHDEAIFNAASELLCRIFTEVEVAQTLQPLAWKLRFAAETRAAQRTGPESFSVMVPDEVLARRRRRYTELLEKIELPHEGFATRDQYRAAANLSQTYRLLREREAQRKVPPTPKDPRVNEAERLKSLYQRQIKSPTR